MRDSSPDAWGRRVIERHVGKSPLTELDFLLHSPDDRAGALSFGLNSTPPAPLRVFNKTLELSRLQHLADRILEDDVASKVQVEELLLVGTSMGGARPKTVVEDEEGLWLAKFNRPNDDRWNMARVEHAMLLLAAKCGVQVAKSRVVAVGERDVLLVKRFDRERVREGYRRSRMVSALTLLGAEDTAQSRTRWSYPTLVEQLRRSCGQARRDSHELFRRICFNALISNMDDHPRNHAFLAHGDDWQLSPAYDLTPIPHVSAERHDLAMEVGPAGRWANAENLVSEAPRFLLEPAEARAIVDTMEKQVRSSWRRLARKCGVSERDCEQIARAFACPGFRLPLT